MGVRSSWKQWIDESPAERDTQPAPRSSAARSAAQASGEGRARAPTLDLDTIVQLAERASDDGDHLKAAELYAELMAASLDQYGPDHPAVLSAEASWAAEMGFAGDPCCAAEELADTVESMVDVLGQGDPRTVAAAEAARAWAARCQEIVSVIAECDIPSRLRYTLDHVWMTPPPLATVGLTEVITDGLTVVDVDWLAEEGSAVVEGELVVSFEVLDLAEPGEEGVLEVRAPLTGTIFDTNKELKRRLLRISEDWDAIVRDPYESGWIFRMTIDDPQDYHDALFDAEEYADLLYSELAGLEG
jgi:glycine cleavage system H lipoate-binding protein